MSDFVHLHLHTEYSLLDGACRIRDIPEKVRAAGHSAVAITDHGAMYGCVEFWRACTDAGIRPIIGCEVYMAPGSRFDRISGPEGGSHHLVLLCENDTGYKNLIYIVSRAWTEGFYSRPRIDMELLRDHHEGLIALSACLSGEIPSALSAGEREKAAAIARRYAAVMGEGCFFIELQNHGIAEERQVLPELYDLARELGLPVVATNDVHYLKKSDAGAQQVLMCIQTNSTVNDVSGGRGRGFETSEFYYKSTEEMEALFGGFEGALENTVRIAGRCRVNFTFGKYLLPAFPLPPGTSAGEVLRRRTEEGLERLFASGRIPWTGYTEKDYRDRADYELEMIHGMGYDDYFLIVADYVGHAKQIGLAVGPGRGSGCGSLVAFAAGITDVDPLRFDLFFERFLNPERVSMPDIDIDFDYNRRDEMLTYVREKYGSEHVTQIITFGTLAARAAVRDSGRALGMSYDEVDAVAKLIPRELDVTLERAMEVPELRELYEKDEPVRRLLDTARALEGMPRNVSVHAAGVVITGEPVTDYVPLSLSNGAVITQYDMDTVAALGLLKFDFLALRYLTIIDDAVKQIREREPDFDMEKADMDDPETYALIGAGQTGGVFQLESGGMRQMLGNLRPTCIEDIIAAISLYRPGPMDSIPRYIEGKNDPASVQYPHPMLEPILRSTHGCIVYQEQVMNIFRTAAGYSLGHADVVRRAMSKKKASALAAERDGFITGAAERGMTEEAAAKLFDDMSGFASYAFNKSHAAAYAVLAFRTAYLKAHYPREYFAALLTSVLDSREKVAEYIAEAGKRGIRVLPPDINRSMADFHVTGNDITFGLGALKNVGRQFIECIVRERESGPFLSFRDFLERMAGGTELNRKMLEMLIKAGCFDALGVYRSRLLAALTLSLDSVSQRSRSNIEGQLDMFSMQGAQSVGADFAVEYPDLPELSFHDLLMVEREAAGMYFSGHLLDGYAKHLEKLKAVPVTDVVSGSGDGAEGEAGAPRYPDGAEAVTAGVITSVTLKNTRAGERMAFFDLEDSLGVVEVLVFPKKYAALRTAIREEAAVCVSGRVSRREGEDTKLLLNTLVPLKTDEEMAAQAQPVPTPAPAGSGGAEKPAADGGAKRGVYTGSPGNYGSREAAKPAPAGPGQLPWGAPRVVYVKVPSRTSRQYLKCANLADIFEPDGPRGVRLTFYFADEEKYEDHPHPLEFSGYVLGELRALAGEKSVVIRYQA